jgi:uncharacterized protein
MPYDDPPPPRTPACPICGKPRAAAFKPFCSKRCADIDLYRWLSGGYRIETDEPPEDGAADSGRGKP